MDDLIRRADAMGAVQDHFNADGFKGYDDGQKMMDRIKALPSAEAVHKPDYSYEADMVRRLKGAQSAETVQGWRTGKPKKQGEYIVTVKSMRGGMVELLYYGKPMMPNCKVKGMCWYRSDDEWGDVVYDDKDILAWMPLPEPYREDGEV